jgi:2-haloacid dehalogenase
MTTAITSVVFDLGNVLVDWDPRYLYRRLFNNDEDAVNKFLSEVCTPQWNMARDRGSSFAEGEAQLIARFPEKADLIRAWKIHYNEMMKGDIEGSVTILGELRAQGIPLYALTNWSAETFPIGRERFAFFGWFRGIVVSGEEKIAKPDARIYQILINRFNLDAYKTLFIDDRQENIDAAKVLGFKTIHFTNPDDLRKRLEDAELLGKSAKTPELEIV